MSEQLTILDRLPDGFFELESRNIRSLFPAPTLIRLAGDRQPPLFVSILLHGNEYSGLKSVQSVLGKYGSDLPRPVLLFIGNVRAAEAGVRMLPDQYDYNRCWPGAEIGPNATTRLMQQVFDEVTQKPLFAMVDLHNNTGTNPHYAGINDVTRDNQHLAAMFNHIGLVFDYPPGICSHSFSGICPAATLECGRPGDKLGIHHAAELIDALLHLDHFPQKPVAPHDLQLVQSRVALNVPDDVSFDFNLAAQADLTFEEGFERKNFTEIKPTDVFAYTRIARPLTVVDNHGEDVTDEIMRVENGRVYLNRTMMPAMITSDKTIVRQDCLCYLMVDYREEMV